MTLPSATDLNPEQEVKRFNWLRHGNKQQRDEIHGGSGFSRRLLQLFSQITYCAARLKQEPETPVVPLTAELLLAELVEMRQWSNEFTDWETAKAGRPTIRLIQALQEASSIDSARSMTDVTAEAWRLAAIVYLQCRLLRYTVPLVLKLSVLTELYRLPRNSPFVVANLEDLAECIRLMPVSGTYFTAQSPLFPTFLLGMLATVPQHKEIARCWFELVVQTPVRNVRHILVYV